MDFLAEAFVAFLIVVGGIFGLVGSYGLAKLPDTMMRLHAPTKATTLGVGSILIASMSYFLFFENLFSVHELLITLFLFIAAPLTANVIAKAHLHDDRVDPKQLPAPDPQASGQVPGWSTFDPEAERQDVR